MKQLNITLILLVFLCQFNSGLFAQKTLVKKTKSPISNTKQKLLDTDKDFCKMSLKSGMKAAFVNYADKEVVKMEQDKHPVFGIEALKASMKDDKENPSNLFWTPVKAEVSKSNDLGYTFGNWQWPAKTKEGRDTTYYGNYVTIWKKQADGKWKYVLDTGTSTPKPKEK